MKLQEQVCSLELAQKLKTLGVKQESLFYWRLGYHTYEKFDKGISLGKVGHFDHNFVLEYYPHPRYTTADVKWNQADLQKLDQTELSAFTGAELGEMLPIYPNGLPFVTMGGWKSIAMRNDDGTAIEKSWQTADTEAEARGLMLEYLIKNNLIEV